MLAWLPLAAEQCVVIRAEAAENKRTEIQSVCLQRLLDEHAPGTLSNNQSLVRWLDVTQPIFAALPESEFTAALQQLAMVVKALTPNIGTQRTMFARMTAQFKKYWVPMGEQPNGSLDSPHIALAKKYLRAEAEAVAKEIVHREAVLRDHLSDKPTEDFARLSALCVNLARQEVFGESVAMETSSWLLAIIMACGCRKGEILDASIQFLPVPKVDFFGDALGKNVRVRNREIFEEQIGSEMCIMQVGFVKEKSQRINQFVTPEDPRYVKPRSIVKPCLFLHPMDVIELIVRFRVANSLSAENPHDRLHSSKRFGTRPAMFKSAFEQSQRHASERSWSLGTHHARKIYANASYNVFAPKLQRINGALMDRNAWIELVLGHTGSLLTSLSYSTVHVNLDETQCNPQKKQRILQ
jgi:hypothetical protein